MNDTGYCTTYFCHSCCFHITPIVTNVRDKGKTYDLHCPNGDSHRIDSSLRRRTDISEYSEGMANKAEENIQEAIKKYSKLEKVSLSN